MGGLAFHSQNGFAILRSRSIAKAKFMKFMHAHFDSVTSAKNASSDSDKSGSYFPVNPFTNSEPVRKVSAKAKPKADEDGDLD